MTKKQKQELIRIEKDIVKLSNYVEGHGFVTAIEKWDQDRREELRDLLGKRCRMLDEMFLCTEEEVADFKKTNERLFTLTEKMHSKALSLYKAILKEGYDPEFDDDIMVEGTLRYVFNDPWESVIMSEEEESSMYQKIINPYGSNFPVMLDILFEYYETTGMPECASCFTSYDIYHRPDMDAKDLGLDNAMDDGQSWDEGYLHRKEFEDICICYAVHDLCDHKMYSIPDLLRMNDFWCEVKVTHQLLSDRDGKRFSCILHDQR